MIYAYTKPRYQVSVYRTIGPLVSSPELKAYNCEFIVYPCSGVCQSSLSSIFIHNAQPSSPKSLGQSNPNFMWSIL